MTLFEMECFSKYSSDEEEYEGILKQALEVKLSSDFNPNSVPRDGNDQLKMEYNV